MGKPLLKNNFLELIRETKQFLLEKKQKHPFLFSKHISSPKKPLIKPQVKQTSSFFTPSSNAPTAKTSDSNKAAKDDSPSSLPNVEPVKTIAKESIPSFHSLRAIIEKSCPSLRLAEKTPSDEEASQRKNAWKRREFDVEILLLNFAKDPREKKLLENIGKAINTLEKRCQSVDALNLERERSWHSFLELPSLSFIIAPPLDTWQTPLLKALIQLHPIAGKAYLGKAEILFIPPLDKILADSSLKPKLWRVLDVLRN